MLKLQIFNKMVAERSVVQKFYIYIKCKIRIENVGISKTNNVNKHYHFKF